VPRTSEAKVVPKRLPHDPHESDRCRHFDGIEFDPMEDVTASRLPFNLLMLLLRLTPTTYNSRSVFGATEFNTWFQ
jgi:hypothetical protein